MKKLAVFAIMLLALPVLANGTETSGYDAPVVEPGFNFIARSDGSKVIMEWYPIAQEKSELFKYYKVVRSSINSNPVYPEDGYIFYDANVGTKRYVDEQVPTGVNYYRVCAIYEKARLCSEVKKVYYEQKSDNVVNNYDELKYLITTNLTNVSSLDDYASKASDLRQKVVSSYGSQTISADQKQALIALIESYKPKYKEGGENQNMDNIKDTYDKVKEKVMNKLWKANSTNWAEVKTSIMQLISEKLKQGTISQEQHDVLVTIVSQYDAKFSGSKNDGASDNGNANKSDSSAKNRNNVLIKIKLDAIVDKFLKQLDKSDMDNEAKIKVIENVQQKIKVLKESKPSISQMLEYLYQRMQSAKEFYQDDLKNIEEIFKL